MRPRVKPSTRGIWLVAASGHTFRHSPGATNQTSGSSGTSTFHHTSSPVSGSAMSSVQTASVASAEAMRSPRQTA